MRSWDGEGHIIVHQSQKHQVAGERLNACKEPLPGLIVTGSLSQALRKLKVGEIIGEILNGLAKA
ncbi:hypothetical protein TM102_06990 [Bradyrhizobium sp. TM102]|nr:hypothetical protein TM102_06990 [Bradyrhizobium sp. TM102]